MNALVTALTKSALNLVYPLHCLVCRTPLPALHESHVCISCLGRIEPNLAPYCIKCGRTVEHSDSTCIECRTTPMEFDHAYAATLYTDTIKELIHLFKFKNKTRLAQLFSSILTDFIRKNNVIMDGIDMIAYVPLEKRRLREREFNQSKLIAGAVALDFSMPLIDALQKIRATHHQNELDREERLTNLAYAFTARSDISLDGKRILLIDDVMTTGSTMSECARALKSAGAVEVRCLALARGT